MAWLYQKRDCAGVEGKQANTVRQEEGRLALGQSWPHRLTGNMWQVPVLRENPVNESRECVWVFVGVHGEERAYMLNVLKHSNTSGYKYSSVNWSCEIYGRLPKLL